MEHEVFVPVPVERLREALGDPVRVARAVPGLQQDAGADPVAGRVKVRVGSHSVTYRGAAHVSARDDGSYAVEGDATEARGTGSVKLALTLRLRDTDGGTTLTFDGTATADGRVTELPQDAVRSAVVRLLNRFAEALGEAREEPERVAEAEGTPEAPETTDAPETPETTDAPEAPEATDAPEAPEDTDAPETTPETARTPEEEHPPAPLADDFTQPAEPPAEAAHARRTMIGRSAEEVDHAPPRGRYAPVPAPQTVVAGATLRWAAPAAAVALASAIVVTRVLRKRR
ncbi:MULTISPECIES: SRPBCC domain-containing protein [unclassified Streptomyces]|uniref:SRPBCC domain-containing protein n=1 Tax=unclassified Streptomyces TaxID=2593676 RepID=UPI001BB079C0|nr:MULTISPECIES: SRPBCC domain-containing protein [unclassified Streptomyces]MDH6451735.1 carbon monoxide dehydrogenase subunit G [Streptomyces sp. SAI-119]MDH6497708.1 carbon monoxide dehydrogenase subunit G [Streptomyces sp. SAI-149]QUC55605.1 carbon monoxide dehydrogenase subunit G [Streptomyces sp. A2-16]